MTAPEAAIPLLTDAAARIEVRCRQLTAPARLKRMEIMLPDWQESDAETRRTVAGIFLQCVTAEGEQLHAFLK